MQCFECWSDFNGKKDSKFCCRACYYKSMEKHTIVKCGQCGQSQERPLYRVKKGSKNCFCSKECQYLYQSGENSNLYNEGESFLCNTSGFRYVLKDKRFRVEHRVNVENEIGRRLNYYGEPILHLNGNKEDNRLENLYVCESNSEMVTILNTMNTPYPYNSNVKDLKGRIASTEH